MWRFVYPVIDGDGQRFFDETSFCDKKYVVANLRPTQIDSNQTGSSVTFGSFHSFFDFMSLTDVLKQNERSTIRYTGYQLRPMRT